MEYVQTLYEKKWPHPIYIGDISDTLTDFLEQQADRQLFLLCDENTERICLPILASVFKNFPLVGSCTLPVGEAHKNINTCQQVWQAMLDVNLDRKALVINLGGGVVGDLGGFCAATWKRGLDFIQIPTTLLAMTDAALGGKTGIDFQMVKNSIGAFQQPKAVFVDSRFLQTLPDLELVSGLAEVVKHAFIGEKTLWAALKDISHAKNADWAALLPASILVKMKVVAKDEKENGLRKVLNFGHTIGHAYESWSHLSGSPITHGHAVALGMVAEMQLIEPNSKRFVALKYFVEKHYAPFIIPKSEEGALRKLMQNDKKNVGQSIRFVLPGTRAYTFQEFELN